MSTITNVDQIVKGVKYNITTNHYEYEITYTEIVGDVLLFEYRNLTTGYVAIGNTSKAMLQDDLDTRRIVTMTTQYAKVYLDEDLFEL